LVENNPELTMEEVANIYYDTQGMATPTMKYQRGNFLVFDDEFKNLTTYMCQLHEYYMAQATDMTDFCFEVIIRSPFVYHYPEEENFRCRVGVLVPAIPETLSRYINVVVVDYVRTLLARYYN
jgi:hypothetical protein